MTIPEYEHIKWEIVVQEMEPENLFSYTWHPFAIDSTKDYSGETPTLVEFRLKKTSDSTLLTVVESGFDKIPEHRRSEAFKMHEHGWTEQMKNIERFVTKSPVS